MSNRPVFIGNEAIHSQWKRAFLVYTPIFQVYFLENHLLSNRIYIFSFKFGLRFTEVILKKLQVCTYLPLENEFFGHSFLET
jgi:hypothetical protein